MTLAMGYPIYPQNAIIGYSRRVSLVCTAGESQHRAMLGQLPGTDTGLDELVDGWGVVDQVGHPSVPVYSISKTKALHLFS